MRWPGFCGPFDKSQSIEASGAMLTNWYVQQLPKSARADFALYPTPGTRLWSYFTDVGCRALYEINNRMFAVIGGTVYEVLGPGRFYGYSPLKQDGKLAYLVVGGVDGNQLLIASGTNAYCMNLTTYATTQVLTGEATQIGMLDRYFLAFHDGRLRISDLDDGLTWDPTQVAVRGSASDDWRAMLVNPPDIWLVGEQTGDVWYDAGTFPFPFAPRSGLIYKYGIAAVHSIAAAGASVLWLARNRDGDGVVVRTRGYQPNRASTAEIEAEIAEYARTTTIDDAEGWTYQQEGKWFYVLRFPAYATWVLDLETNLWHRRSTFDTVTATELPWRPRVHCQAFGKHLVGDASSGVISEMDVSFGSEFDGAPIRRSRVPPALFREHQVQRIKRVEVFLESGLGLVSGQGSDPQMIAESSDDGGQTWGHERWLSAGKIGEYPKRLILRRCGRSRNRVTRFTVTDPIPWRVVDVFVNNE